VSTSVTARAPGKVNIQLSVGAVRDDGFHPLASVFHAVAMAEEVTVSAGAPGSGIEIATVTGPQSDEVPRDASNLVWRAAQRLAAELDRSAPDLRIAISKGVPVAGGMAGGSADCAAALVAINDLWGSPLARAGLARVALDLGSDVPFSLMGGTALGLGRGEVLSPLMVRGTFHWVFATATRGLSTPAVYAAFDRLVEGRIVPEPEAEAAVISALIAGDAQALGRVLHNDLQDPALALRPTLRDVLDSGMGSGALGGIVSGSGPTVAFLVADPASGARVHAAVVGLEQVRAAFTTTGPAPGARVISRTE
jgi:4-diphosphocytidyl-2-C-methyl-D-erythritol kinase